MIGQPGVALTVKSIDRPFGKLSENGFELEVAEEDEAVSNCGGIFTATVDETDLVATDAVGSNGDTTVDVAEDPESPDLAEALCRGSTKLEDDF